MSHHVYQVLSISNNQDREQAVLAQAEQKAASDQWLIQSPSEDGQNIYYQLCAVYPQGRDYDLNLPWEVEEPCPSCQGQGLIYRWNRAQAAYEPAECPDCRGQGSNMAGQEFSLTVNDGLGGQRVIRKRPGGHLNARLGLRGDLIVNISWVEELPETSSCEEARTELRAN
jgi:hypothetical protein